MVLRPWEETPAEALTPGTRVGPYEVERFLGRGGMGAVYLVRRVQDYSQLAALKVIGRGVGAASQRRFHAERQLLAQLEHPNIVRLLDGGSTGGGEPYLVMEYIDGEPLDDYCRRKGSTVAERVRLLAVVARAVAYAHDHDVLHRDLKPGNVLVTPDGVAKVTDFGIARTVRREGTATETGRGAVLGTPSYMAPEQVLNGPGRNLPGVDCYGLGAILYRLLTGRPPFLAETPLETCLLVATEEPVPVRQRDRAVPRDLETVVRKAMARDARDRYPTALELAEDLERFLANRPVLATPPSPTDLLAKWVRRHRAAAAALVAFLAVAAAGLAVSVQTVRLERDARKADFDLAFGAVEKTFAGLDDSPLLRGRRQPERGRLLRPYLAYFEEFLRRSGGDPGVRLALARAHLGSGRITQEIGPKAEALGHYEAACGLLAGLADGHPRDASYRVELARARLGRAELFTQTGRPGAAAREYEASVALWQRLVEERPGDPARREGLGNALARLAAHRMNFEGRGAAARAMEAAGEFYRRSAEANPEVSAYRVGLADHDLALGHFLLKAGDAAGGGAAFRRAVATSDALAAAGPTNPGFLHRRAWARYCLGAMQRDRGDAAEARRSLGEARAIWEPVVAANPDVTEYRDGLARCCQQLGLLEHEAGSPEDAVALFREAVAHRELIAGRQPDWAPNTLMLGLAYCTTGQVHHDAGRSGEARAWFDKATRLFREALERYPFDPDIAVEQVHLLANGPEDSSRDPARAVVYAEQAVERFPGSARPGRPWRSPAGASGSGRPRYAPSKSR